MAARSHQTSVTLVIARWHAGPTLLCLLLAACRLEWGAQTTARADEEITVYTSAYPAVVQQLQALAQSEGLRVQFFQAGSEKLAARLDAERLAQNPGADVLVASDPFYYLKLKREQALKPYASVRALRLDKRWVDLDGAFATCRVSLVGLVSRAGEFTPTRVSDLWRQPNGTLPDPLGSGTMLTALIAWTHAYPDAISRLKQAHIIAAGGGTAVVDRLQHRQATFGAALSENIALAHDDALRFTEPEEGVVLVPGYIALLKHAKPGAERVYDLFLSERAQAIFVGAGMRSPFALGAIKELPYPMDETLAQSAREAWAK